MSLRQFVISTWFTQTSLQLYQLLSWLVHQFYELAAG